jgi:hypothetical protein
MEYTKKDARVTIALPGHIESWLNDRARSLRISRSELICNWIMGHLEDQSGVRTLSCGTPKIAEKLQAAQATIGEALRSIGMIPAGRREGKRRVS